MEISVSIGDASISIAVENPFHIDLDFVAGRIESFCSSKGATLNGINVRGLIPRMIKGVAGCERGCPADAKEFVHRGLKEFSLAYVEGGILTAKAVIGNNKELSIKMFPDF
ncbi:MAG: hypothetical protein HY035_01510 [Nitrospirae bacterium]|nr:hypothetical protein [Nitrospirota bacterium]MBI3377067.1 hypothetical protein [Nitrospirota bacterium]